MTIIGNLNFWFTIVSIVVTLISIGASILSFRSAKCAKKYKDDAMCVMDTLDLKSITNSYYTESSRFQSQTRKPNWFKGTDVNVIISPFSDILTKLGELYPLLEDSQELENKVSTLYGHIQQYDRATEAIRKDCANLIIEIANILQVAVRSKISTLIHL